MPILTVKLAEEELRIPFVAGRSLRDILDSTEVRVRSGCRGTGSCGLCRVRIVAGDTEGPTGNERVLLGTEELDRGTRLACQLRPQRDLRVTILAVAPKSVWRSLPVGEEGEPLQVSLPPGELPPGVTTPYGVAVDLGTTHIRLSWYELTGGRWVTGRYGLNPQSRYGSDVVSRLVAASESPEQAAELSALVIEALGDALFDIAAREGRCVGQVTRLALVGNTAMLALLSGRNHHLLLQASHWMRPIDCLPEGPQPWGASLGIHGAARIEMLPPLAGYVGSDLLAGVLATRLTAGEGGALFIDFGTNSEIALWDGGRLWVTSAAGGPAFEESGIGCGAPAEPGAIHRVGLEDGAFAFGVIGDREPHGLCGSGLVDLIACLVGSGRLTATGRFTPTDPEGGFVLARGAREIVLTKRDVDLFQRAKSAIGTGIRVLLAQAGLEFDGLARVCLGGFFGSYLDIANAKEIGLIPPIPAARVELCGGTALAGCAQALVSPAAAALLRGFAQSARLVDMSASPDFDRLFLENLYLRPMQGSSDGGEDHAGL